MVYESICHNLLKVMRRLIKASSLDDKYDKELTIIPYQNFKLQLSDSDWTLAIETWKALDQLKSEKQKSALLGIHSLQSCPWATHIWKTLVDSTPQKGNGKQQLFRTFSISFKLNWMHPVCKTIWCYTKLMMTYLPKTSNKMCETTRLLWSNWSL